VFLGGGFNDIYRPSKLAWIYNLEDDVWMQVDPMPEEKNGQFCGYFAADNQVVVTGGM